MADANQWSAGRAAWPTIDLPCAELEAWRAARGDGNPAFAKDHYLACACLIGVAGAADAFKRHHLDGLGRHLGTLARSPDVLDELRQRLAVRLLVGVDERGPRIGDYSGQGSLEGWVRIVATREALQLTRKERHSEYNEVLDERLVDVHDAELHHIRQRYRPHFKRALEVALKSLAPTHRMSLRLHFVEGMTTAAMATLYQVSRATAVRRITEAKDALRDGIADELARGLKLSPSEQAELLTAVRSTLEVSVLRLLGDDR